MPEENNSLSRYVVFLCNNPFRPLVAFDSPGPQKYQSTQIILNYNQIVVLPLPTLQEMYEHFLCAFTCYLLSPVHI